jgi:hypothetical protein
MGKTSLIPVATACAFFMVACGREGLMVSSGSGGHSGSMDAAGGASGGFVIQLPDGGLSAILGDSGILRGILDAPRDSLLGQIICGSEAKLAAPCSSTTMPGCILPSLGGVCACINDKYLCPLNTSAGPQPCPAGAATGTSCLSPLSTCIGGSTNGCICGLGTYICF